MARNLLITYTRSMGGARHILMVQVRGKGVRPEVLLKAGYRLAEPEAARAVPHVKADTPLPLLPQEILHLSLFVQQGKLLGKHMGVDVPGLQAAQDGRIAALGYHGNAVHHHPRAAEGRGLPRPSMEAKAGVAPRPDAGASSGRS